MHELGIAQSILHAVAAEMEKRPGAVPIRIGVRIGELAGVNPEALDFGFTALVRETDWSALKLEIIFLPRRQRCLTCDNLFSVRDLEYACPDCQSSQTTFAGGDELELEYLEVEEDSKHDASPITVESP
jgi:hydrogenase nickel incorporation protein HypA/HybF